MCEFPIHGDASDRHRNILHDDDPAWTQEGCPGRENKVDLRSCSRCMMSSPLKQAGQIPWLLTLSSEMRPWSDGSSCLEKAQTGCTYMDL